MEGDPPHGGQKGCRRPAAAPRPCALGTCSAETATASVSSDQGHGRGENRAHLLVARSVKDLGLKLENLVLHAAKFDNVPWLLVVTERLLEGPCHVRKRHPA